MKRVSIQDLKAGLSTFVAEAKAGTTILVTRNGEPAAQLVQVRPAHVHRGRDTARGRLRPALKRGTKGRHLAVLLEDRGAR